MARVNFIHLEKKSDIIQSWSVSCPQTAPGWCGWSPWERERKGAEAASMGPEWSGARREPDLRTPGDKGLTDEKI